MRTMLNSKIHRARVTERNVDYEGSITIDKLLMEAADILEYEQVEVQNINNAARFTTYTMEGEKGSGIICLNGAAARLFAKGDVVIILCYRQVLEEQAHTMSPTTVCVDKQNRIVDIKGPVSGAQIEKLLPQL